MMHAQQKKIATNTFVGSQRLDSIRLPRPGGNNFYPYLWHLSGNSDPQKLGPTIAQTVSITHPFESSRNRPISGADHVEVALPAIHRVYRKPVLNLRSVASAEHQRNPEAFAVSEHNNQYNERGSHGYDQQQPDGHTDYLWNATRSAIRGDDFLRIDRGAQSELYHLRFF